MSTIEVYVDTDDVLPALPDRELLAEVRRRKLEPASIEGLRRDDLVRALARQDWREVDYLLRTYFLREEMRTYPAAPQRIGRAA